MQKLIIDFCQIKTFLVLLKVVIHQGLAQRCLEQRWPWISADDQKILKFLHSAEPWTSADKKTLTQHSNLALTLSVLWGNLLFMNK